ncbi:Nuclear transport factor 2 (NTF2) domain [Rhizoctonia solani]|uniref:Nuclear transport factor 2 (NTF2) domain n=1 Tax=Rhizoctonia solani TaxID=456999 RepID=A0A8H7M8Q7_9AGAM|nr:Nuclear transport factor 2 (NTF2) domain [Rhizoctonia solani]
MASPAPNAQAKSTVVPSEVGWQFVSQYYTYVNKEPSKLHCFYTKHSTYTHGVEGEDSPRATEIHNKIISIGFQDCKVFIHSVDAQSSASSGILIQVIGEISNAGEAWRKFSQSFFLAEQPNGYFVLNDIFRYLKEETNADDEVSSDKEEAETGEEAAVEPTAATQLHDVPEHPVAQPEPEPVVSLPPAAPQETAAPEPAPDAPAVNGTHVEEKTPEPAKETTQLPSPSPEPEPQPAEEPAPAEPAPTPTLLQLPRQLQLLQTPRPQPLPHLLPPRNPKSLLLLLHLLLPPLPNRLSLLLLLLPRPGRTSLPPTAPAKPATPTPKPAAPAPAPVARKEEPPIDTSNLSPQAQAALSVNTPQCFVKLNDWVRDNAAGNQTQSNAESVSPAALKEVLTARFGAIKELEVVRTKACAFLEFVQVDSARRAILASLPTNQGGEGGIRIGEDTPNERAPRITVEMRKERGDRPMSGGRPRTGGPEQRGSFRGRGGRGRGDGTRGGAPQAAK